VPRLTVEVWSDVACPWCYVGKRRLETALVRFPERASVDVVWRAFELDPAAPRSADPRVSYSERLARKYATSTERAEEMIRAMTATAASEGLDFHFERIRPGNTFDAHRVLHLAARSGCADAAKERLLRAYLTEGEPIGEREVLVRLAGDVGLDAGAVRSMLAGDAGGAEVRADEERARARGILGVPHFVIGGTGISGAQPAEVLQHHLAAAWAALPADRAADAVPEGGSCEPDRCD